jgi:hypothetical protein
LQAGVRSAASAEQLGESFRYVIDQPVTLPRQKSALLPIAGEDIASRRLSIYNPATHPKFPMLGMIFHNTSKLHLMQGPVTIFEGSVFAGDAKLPDLQPGEKRLLAYAIDTGCEVEAANPHGSQKLTNVRVRRGVLEITNRLREDRTYTAVNRSAEDKILWIEHPYRSEMQLVSETKPVERTQQVQRFELTVPTGQTAKLTVSEERDQGTVHQLTNTNDETIRYFIRQPQASDKVKAALEDVIERKDRLAKTTREIQEVERELKRIADDQTRLRQNLREMPEKAAAYPKYLKKFDDQETEIDALTAKLKTLRAEELKLRNDLDKFLLSLDLS